MKPGLYAKNKNAIQVVQATGDQAINNVQSDSKL